MEFKLQTKYFQGNKFENITYYITHKNVLKYLKLIIIHIYKKIFN